MFQTENFRPIERFNSDGADDYLGGAGCARSHYRSVAITAGQVIRIVRQGYCVQSKSVG
jgi:hypothetical protein